MGGLRRRRRRGVYWWLSGRKASSPTVRQGSWILAASQIFLMAVPLFFIFFKTVAYVALAILAIVALVFLFTERETQHLSDQLWAAGSDAGCGAREDEAPVLVRLVVDREPPLVAAAGRDRLRRQVERERQVDLRARLDARRRRRLEAALEPQRLAGLPCVSTSTGWPSASSRSSRSAWSTLMPCHGTLMSSTIANGVGCGPMIDQPPPLT